MLAFYFSLQQKILLIYLEVTKLGTSVQTFSQSTSFHSSYEHFFIYVLWKKIVVYHIEYFCISSEEKLCLNMFGVLYCVTVLFCQKYIKFAEHNCAHCNIHDPCVQLQISVLWELKIGHLIKWEWQLQQSNDEVYTCSYVLINQNIWGLHIPNTAGLSLLQKLSSGL